MGRCRIWTGKRLGTICAELAQLNIRVSPNTVRRLLDDLGYALHANRKTLSRGCHDRDQQFCYIAQEKKQFLRRGLPIISVDTKKKELVGNFKNAGRVWAQAATPVKDHDFRSEGKGMAIPFGVYDLARNQGSVFVGMSHDTSQFAAENIARWWRKEDSVTIRRQATSSFWPTAAGAMEPACGCGSGRCRNGLPIRLA